MPIAMLVFSLSLSAEEHHHGEWEIGIAVGYANLKTENEEGENLHLHIMRSLGDEGLAQYFSVGLGAETIRTSETHYGAMLTLAYNPIEALTFAVSPGFEWAKHDGVNWNREYATHLETTYSFDIAEGYHIGPSIGYSKTKDAEHYTVGVHVGIAI